MVALKELLKEFLIIKRNIIFILEKRNVLWYSN